MKWQQREIFPFVWFCSSTPSLNLHSPPFLSILYRWPRLSLPSCWPSSSHGRRITSWCWFPPSASPASLTLCGLLATGCVMSTLLLIQLVTHCAMPLLKRHLRTCFCASIKILVQDEMKKRTEGGMDGEGVCHCTNWGDRRKERRYCWKVSQRELKNLRQNLLNELPRKRSDVCREWTAVVLFCNWFPVICICTYRLKSKTKCVSYILQWNKIHTRKMQCKQRSGCKCRGRR